MVFVTTQLVIKQKNHHPLLLAYVPSSHPVDYVPIHVPSAARPCSFALCFLPMFLLPTCSLCFFGWDPMFLWVLAHVLLGPSIKAVPEFWPIFGPPPLSLV